jgi:hypothetical protein
MLVKKVNQPGLWIGDNDLLSVRQDPGSIRSDGHPKLKPPHGCWVIQPHLRKRHDRAS